MFRIHCLSIKKIKGMMLMELMIASVIGLMLIACLLDVFLTCERSFRLQSDMNAIQVKASMAIEILNSEIHKAGYIGCAKLTKNFPFAASGGFLLNVNNRLIGQPAEITSSHAGFPAAALLVMNANEDELVISPNINFNKHAILLISDCHHAETGEIKSVIHERGKQSITLTQPLHYSYGEEAEVSRYESNTFFVGKMNAVNHHGVTQYAMYRRDLHGYKSRIVAGIRAIHFAYFTLKQGKLLEINSSDLNQGQSIDAVEIEMSVASGTIEKKWHAFVGST